jgi:hypothetical protein
MLYENLQTPQTFPTLVVAFAKVMIGVVTLIPLSWVLRRSQPVSAALEHTAEGMLPARLGFEVRDKVEREVGRDEGARLKALFCKYLSSVSSRRARRGKQLTGSRGM